MDRRLAGMRNLGATFALASLGAVIGHWTGIPLGLLIGPMVVLTVCAQRFPDLRVPPRLYGAALVVIGMSLGQYFTPEILAAWRRFGGAIAANTVLALAAIPLSYLLLRRAFGYNRATALFAGLPGGILSVMEVSRESDADTGAVLFFQIFRIILGATLIPFGFALAGFELPSGAPPVLRPDNPATLHDIVLLVGGSIGLTVLGRRLRFPSAEISAPLLWSAVLYASGVVSMTIPAWLPGLAFVIVGAAVGTLLPRPGLRKLLVLGLQTLTLFAVFMSLTLLAALVLSPWLNISVAAGILTFSPASLTEMAVVAVALGLEPALVVANNMYRMLFCSILAPLMLVWLRRNGATVTQ